MDLLLSRAGDSTESLAWTEGVVLEWLAAIHDLNGMEFFIVNHPERLIPKMALQWYKKECSLGSGLDGLSLIP